MPTYLVQWPNNSWSVLVTKRKMSVNELTSNDSPLDIIDCPRMACIYEVQLEDGEFLCDLPEHEKPCDPLAFPVSHAGTLLPLHTAFRVIVGHRSSIAGARWCKPAGWSPRNRFDGADWCDEDGAWIDANGEYAGIVVFHHYEEGETVTVSIDDLRVATSGECRVIGEVEVSDA